MKRLIALLFALSFVVSSLSAHPAGHEGGFGETVAHMLSHPYHFLIWGSALVFGGLVVWRLVRSGKKEVNR